MKNRALNYLLRMSFLALLAASFLCPSAAFGAITFTNGQWTTTFNCADYNQYPGYPDVTCDGLETGGNWVASGSQGDKILVAANNPNGGGGKGYQHSVGSGTNNNGGGLNANFPTTSELWVRWYMKYPTGFSWTSLEYDKHLYFHGTAADVVPEFYGFGSYRIYSDAGGTYQTGNYGWTQIMGGSTGDGKWHCYEVHLKSNTSGSNGIWEFWVDGIRRANFTNVNYGGGGWNNFGMMTNQAVVNNNGNVVNVHWDDIKVSTTGYIGPLGVVGGGDTTPPTVSTNLSATPISSSEINLTWTASTDAVGVAGYNIYRGGSLIGTSATNSFSSTGLSASTQYTYSVSAYDAAGNTSAQSTPASATTQAGQAQTVLLNETFEDTNFSSRGWYDSPSGTISAVEHIPGSAHSFECRFQAGAGGCTGGAPARRLLASPSDDITVEYWVKHTSNWVGSGVSYHPHFIYLLSDLDGDYDSLAWDYLTTYLEENGGKLRIATQDSRNINTSPAVPWANTGGTENRAVAGCNGDSDGHGNMSCYQSGNWYNGKTYDTSQIYFSGSAGAYYKGDWHKIRARLKMNSISGGVAVANGIMQLYFDDALVMNHQNVVFRTGQHPTLKWKQLVIGPYIGDGSPVDQTIWVDNMTVWTTSTAPPPPPAPLTPMTPTIIQIQ